MLCGMLAQTSDEKVVCPSVHPSVKTVKRVHCDKMEERSVQIFIPYEISFSLVFSEEEWLVGGDPFYFKFWVNWPPLE